MIIPALLALHISVSPLPIDDLRLPELESRRFMGDEDAMKDVFCQWTGKCFETWDGESRGKYNVD